MTTWFTADTHFGHGGALGLYKRPFASVPAMDAAMLQRWNEAVAPEDEVFHLGDFALTHKQPGALLDALHGRKHLLAGNNDSPAIQALPGWASVQPFLELEREGTRLVLCHYALRSWRDMGRGALNLHGHSHGRLAPMPRQFDVGVDVRGFRPVTLAELRTRRVGRGARPG